MLNPPGRGGWHAKRDEWGTNRKHFRIARRFVPAHPDVSFTAMNGDKQLKTSPWHEDGRRERLTLIREQLPGVDEVVTRTPPPGSHPKHLLDAGAMLWTARRQSGRAISRFPLEPYWDSEGMRTELVR